MEQAGIIVKYATVKHAQSISTIERSHQKLKNVLRIIVVVDQPQWHQYVNVAVKAHNKTYHTSLRWSLTEVFHGGTSHSEFDLKLVKLIRATSQRKDMSKLLDEINEKYEENVRNTVAAYDKYKTYYDKKAIAQPLNVLVFNFPLNPSYDDQKVMQFLHLFTGRDPAKWRKYYTKVFKSLTE